MAKTAHTAKTLRERVRRVLERRRGPMTPPGEAMVLAALRASDGAGLTVAELVEVLGAPKGTVADWIRRLQGAGKVRMAGEIHTSERHAASKVWRLS